MSESPFAESHNPYAAPAAGSSGEHAELATPAVVQALHQTRPWVIFLSVLGCLGSGLMMIGAVVGGAAMASRQGFGGEIAIMLVYGVMGVLYLVPSFFLFRYGQRIGEFVHDPSGERLGAALEAQKSFWKFVGVLMAIILGIYCLMIPFAIFFASTARS